jgi:hypothetical protein
MEDRPSLQSAGTGIAERAKAIIVQPKAEWPKIAGETTEPMKLLTSYVIPLAAIGPIATLIGGQMFGYSALFVSYKPSLGAALTTAVISFVLTLVSLFVVTFVANFLSPKFGGREDFPSAFRLVAYSMTAAWLAGIFGLIPALAILSIVGLYSLYLFYLGATPVLGVPQDKSVGYTVVTVLVAIVAYIIVGALTAAITGATAVATGASIADRSEGTTTLDLGGLGNISVDGDNQTVDLGELGRIDVKGDTATLTVDGETIRMSVEELEAARAAAD